MVIPKLTPAELRQELYRNFLDLCGDILLLDCILALPEAENGPDPLNAQEVRAVLVKRLADYIDQHAKDMAAVADGLGRA